MLMIKISEIPQSQTQLSHRTTTKQTNWEWKENTYDFKPQRFFSHSRLPCRGSTVGHPHPIPLHPKGWAATPSSTTGSARVSLSQFPSKLLFSRFSPMINKNHLIIEIVFFLSSSTFYNRAHQVFTLETQRTQSFNFPKDT